MMTAQRVAPRDAPALTPPEGAGNSQFTGSTGAVHPPAGIHMGATTRSNCLTGPERLADGV
jgi:hypothetical protein